MAQIVNKYVVLVNKLRFVIIAFWVVAIALGGWKSLDFIAETDLKFDPPSDSDAVRASQLLEEHFPAVGVGFEALVVILQRADGSSVLGADTAAFLEDLNRTYLAPGVCAAPDTPFRSYFVFERLGMAATVGRSYLSAGGDTMYALMWLYGCPRDLQDYSIWLGDHVRALASTHFAAGQVRAVLSGQAALDQGVTEDIENDMLLCDGVSFPLALLVYCLTLRSLRLVVVPLFTIAASLLTTFLIMYPVAMAKNIFSSAPSLMMSTTIAMSIDYSLFMLSRFREELARGPTQGVPAAVALMLVSSGHTVIVSGTTLTLCFAGLLLFPMELLSSVGIGCSIAVAVTILVNLTLLPSLLLTFPRFFALAAATTSSPAGCLRRCGRAAEGDDEAAPLLGGSSGASGGTGSINSAGKIDKTSPPSFASSSSSYNAAVTSSAPSSAYPAFPPAGASGRNKSLWIGEYDTPADVHAKASVGSEARGEVETGKGGLGGSSSSGGSGAEAGHRADDEGGEALELAALQRSLWFRFSRQLLRHPVAVVLVVLALAAYPTYAGTQFQWTMTGLTYAPRGTDAANAYALMQNTFGLGRLYPFELVLVPDASLSPPEVFARAAAFVNDTLLPLSPPGTLCYSVVHYPGVNYSLVQQCQTDPGALPECVAVRYLATRYWSASAGAVLVELYLGVDPGGPEGIDWLRAVRTRISALPSFSAALAEGQTYSYDAVQVAYGAFPTAIGVTTAVVFVVIGVAFRSLVIPLRSVLTIGMTVGLVYGLATFVYQDNILDFLSLAGVQGTSALSWLPPVLCFSILVGLSLDYDVFLLIRVREYRSKGYSERDSVLLGLTSTGRIITAAGAIMAIAFFGLLFSKEAMLNQLSFFLVMAVLIDTLVIRTLVVPSMMVLIGRFNWFPFRMPAVTRETRWTA